MKHAAFRQYDVPAGPVARTDGDQSIGSTPRDRKTAEFTRSLKGRWRTGQDVILFGSYRISIYDIHMIKSYRCHDTERLANNHRVRRFVAFERIAQRKLMQLKAAETLDMLRVPPGNRLEVLKGDRKGQCSIRTNHQWRLCFRFDKGHAYDVEIVDYH